MALSAKVQKTLTDVKMGLSILYGADYFTEEEWIKLDALIHKGRYIFTHGPPINIVDEQLMSFEESKGDNKTIAKGHTNGHLKSIANEGKPTPEEQVSAPGSSNGEPHAGTPNETSEESSSDEDAVAPPSTSIPPLFDFSEKTPPVASALAEQSKKDYTREQFDEANGFISTAKEDGQNNNSSYNLVGEYASSCQTEEAPTERQARISSWASEVDAAEVEDRIRDVPSPTITSPPTHDPLPPAMVPQFVGDLSRISRRLINDVYQPNNPQHKQGKKRPGSIASVETIETAKSILSALLPPASVTSSKNSLPKLNVLPGTVLIAQRSSPKINKAGLDVLVGDKIKVHRHISGAIHLGKNLRTIERGQFSEDIFKKPSSAVTKIDIAPQNGEDINVINQQAIPDTQIIAEQKAIDHRRGLDEIEKRNAAEWDEVPIRRQKMTDPVAPKIAPKVVLSRYSVLAESDKENDVKEEQERTPGQVEGFKELVGNEVDRILKLHGIRTPPQPDSSSTQVEKTEVCWFWKTGKGCRFTADECMNLHEDRPLNFPLRNGKPTWGSKADLALSTTSPSLSGKTADSKGRVLTCYFWKHEKCTYSPEECKYLHAESRAGTAKRPTTHYQPKKWATESWVKGGDKDGSSDSKSEKLILEEVKGEGSTWGDASAWGDVDVGSTWGEDKYKPPHVLALENKLMQQKHGW